MKYTEMFSPAGISSFFKPCQTHIPPSTFDLRYVGAEGGGFVINLGVHTELEVEKSSKRVVDVYINGRPASEAVTTRTVVNRILNLAKQDHDYRVKVKHWVEVPIGAGYGSSAAGALSTSLGLVELLDLPVTVMEAAMVAHVSEIECGTGLATVAPLLTGGCVLQRGCGGPGISKVIRIPVEEDVKIVSVFFGPIYTRKAVSSPEFMEKVMKAGSEALTRINDHPELGSFMKESRRFSSQLGLQTCKVRVAMDLMDEHGAIGAAQNMIGEAVHGAFYREDVKKALEALEDKFGKRSIYVSGIHFTPLADLDLRELHPYEFTR
jgi:pantoate kinase